MSEFRSYLDNRGSVLSQNQELAVYFALPYIPDPAKHPTFQNLFMVSGVLVDCSLCILIGPLTENLDRGTSWSPGAVP